jgi:hypothetical protein
MTIGAIGADDETHRRLAENQSLYRSVNERIQELGHTVGTTYEWVCECANAECSERVQLSGDEYAAVRAKPTTFLVAPAAEHVFAEVERVTESHAAYWVVEKQGTAAEVAAANAP